MTKETAVILGIFTICFFAILTWKPNIAIKYGNPEFTMAPKTKVTSVTATPAATTTVKIKTEQVKTSEQSLSASKPPAKQTALPHVVSQSPAPKSQIAIAPLVPISPDEIYNSSKPAIFNIWCSENNKITSGTATVIHPSGILLTSAHIFTDIKDAENCVLRSWNPFTNVAKFRKLFVPVQTKFITDTEKLPQYDFAFIKITERLGDYTGSTSPFAYLPIAIEKPVFKEGDALFILSYATEFLSYEISVKGIPLLFSSLTVKDFITIDDNNLDIDALTAKSSIANQAGSSGGPLIDARKNFVAMLSFVSKGKTTGEREAVALLISYIDRVMRRETGASLAEFLAANSLVGLLPNVFPGEISEF